MLKNRLGTQILNHPHQRMHREPHSHASRNVIGVESLRSSSQKSSPRSESLCSRIRPPTFRLHLPAPTVHYPVAPLSGSNAGRIKRHDHFKHSKGVSPRPMRLHPIFLRNFCVDSLELITTNPTKNYEHSRHTEPPSPRAP